MIRYTAHSIILKLSNELMYFRNSIQLKGISWQALASYLIQCVALDVVMQCKRNYCLWLCEMEKFLAFVICNAFFVCMCYQHSNSKIHICDYESIHSLHKYFNNEALEKHINFQAKTGFMHLILQFKLFMPTQKPLHRHLPICWQIGNNKCFE